MVQAYILRHRCTRENGTIRGWRGGAADRPAGGLRGQLRLGRGGVGSSLVTEVRLPRRATDANATGRRPGRRPRRV